MEINVANQGLKGKKNGVTPINTIYNTTQLVDNRKIPKPLRFNRIRLRLIHLITNLLLPYVRYAHFAPKLCFGLIRTAFQADISLSSQKPITVIDQTLKDDPSGPQLCWRYASLTA